jgi:hypothetical protein
LSSATYYRWRSRLREDKLTDQVAGSRPKAPLPTPKQVAAARGFALAHPEMGYKRLAWQMVDEDVAYLRPYQVYRVLKERDLLRRGDRSVAVSAADHRPRTIPIRSGKWT